MRCIVVIRIDTFALLKFFFVFFGSIFHSSSSFIFFSLLLFLSWVSSPFLSVVCLFLLNCGVFVLLLCCSLFVVVDDVGCSLVCFSFHLFSFFTYLLCSCTFTMFSLWFCCGCVVYYCWCLALTITTDKTAKRQQQQQNHNINGNSNSGNQYPQQ